MHLNFFSEQSVVRAAEEAGLHVSHVSTAYQWVTHSKLWCISSRLQRPGAGKREAQAFDHGHSNETFELLPAVCC